MLSRTTKMTILIRLLIMMIPRVLKSLKSQKEASKIQNTSLSTTHMTNNHMM